jgi:hypothetical protein
LATVRQKFIACIWSIVYSAPNVTSPQIYCLVSVPDNDEDCAVFPRRHLLSLTSACWLLRVPAAYHWFLSLYPAPYCSAYLAPNSLCGSTTLLIASWDSCYSIESDVCPNHCVAPSAAVTHLGQYRIFKRCNDQLLGIFGRGEIRAASP